jgi:hypothetical protein
VVRRERAESNVSHNSAKKTETNIEKTTAQLKERILELENALNAITDEINEENKKLNPMM